MLTKIKNIFNRRELFLRGGLLPTVPALFQTREAAAAPPAGLRIGPDIYQSIGVRPIINPATNTAMMANTSMP